MTIAFAWIALIIYVACTGFMVLFSVVQLDLTRRFLLGGKKAATAPLTGSHPLVTIQLPMYNERFVAGRLMEAVERIDWPADRLEIQVLDDSTDETTMVVTEHAARMKAAGLDVKLIRRTTRTGFKAGALAEGLSTAGGAFIAIFDADFVPAPDFLNKTIPLFQEERVGTVQARWGHLNSDVNLLTRLQALGLDAHFTIEQQARSSSGCFLNFNGTCGVWRKSCIIDAGGWRDVTLTEDLDLSYRAQLNGWRIAYLEDLTVPGELPERMDALKAQQYRWTKGGAETARLLMGTVLRANLPAGKKIHAVMHLSASALFPAIFLAGLSSLVLQWTGAPAALEGLLGMASVGFLGFLSVSLFYFASISKNPGNRLWHLPLFLTVSMGLSLHNAVAVVEGWLGRRTPFIRTPKVSSADGHKLRSAEKSYRSVAGAGFMIELLLGGMYVVAVVHEINSGTFGFLLCHGMLAAGYCATGGYSLMEVLTNRRWKE
ncbi:MAG: cellulose synthase family protein [Bacteroidota bacterium]